MVPFRSADVSVRLRAHTVTSVSLRVVSADSKYKRSSVFSIDGVYAHARVRKAAAAAE
jgi:hypothetical protein